MSDDTKDILSFNSRATTQIGYEVAQSVKTNKNWSKNEKWQNVIRYCDSQESGKYGQCWGKTVKIFAVMSTWMTMNVKVRSYENLKGDYVDITCAYQTVTFSI